MFFLNVFYYILKDIFHENYFFYGWWITDLKIKCIGSFQLSVISIMSTLQPLYGRTHLEAKIHIVVKKKKKKKRKPSSDLQAEVCLSFKLPSNSSGVCLVKEDRPGRHRDNWSAVHRPETCSVPALLLVKLCVEFWKSLCGPYLIFEKIFMSQVCLLPCLQLSLSDR